MRHEHPGKVIAIVDDEPAFREAIESLFRSCGFAAETFCSAEEFLDSGCGNRASCVVLDVGLPGMSGIEMQRVLVARGLHVPIVFITAQYDARGRLRAEAMEAGAAAFLRKPAGSLDLLAAVRACFDGRH